MLAVAIAWRGGYGQDARAAIAVLAGVAALVTFASGRAEVPRSPVAWTLGALALLSIVSAAWTVGAAGVAVRDGLAILAVVAVFLVAAALVGSAWAPAAILLGAATGVALVGIVAAIARSDPLALQICGSWRPAGPFEYPPTLALVCAGGLPVAAAVGTAGRRGPALAGGALAWLLALTIGLTANRTAIALGGAALVAAVWLAPARGELGRLAVAAIGAGTASALVVGGRLGDAGAGRILLAAALAAIPMAVAMGAPGGGSGPDPARRGSAGDRPADRGSPASARRSPAWIAIVAAAALAATAIGAAADKGSGCQGDASHGRIGIWKSAVATARHRPLQGYGSGAFLIASRAEQLERRPRPTRFAHDQILESWVELGLLGAALVAAWLVTTAMLLWRARSAPGAFMLIPYAAAFPLANLLDWPWHLLGAGMLWAVAAGALLGLSRVSRPAPG